MPGWPLPVVNVAAWVVPVFGGMLIGAINGFFVAYLRIPAIVVTLGMFSILKGGLILVAGGNTLYNLPAGYSLAMEDPLGIPIPVWIMIVLTAGAFLWMRYSRTGRAQYAVGGNAEAARLSGLDTRRILMTTFILSGAFAGIASVMYATQFQTIQAVATPGLELQVITASVVGGVSILGGVGTVIGSTLAAILIRFIRAALIFLSISPFWVQADPGRPHPRDRAHRCRAPPAPGKAVGDAEMTTATPIQADVSQPSRLMRILMRQETILFVILVAGVLLLSLQSDKFLTVDNLLNQGRLAAEIALIALPMTLIIITGGIDLSVGSIVGLVSIMLGVAWYNWGLPLELAIVVALLIGAACGFFNGLFITRVGLPPMITTLATLALFRGLAEGIAQARSVRGYPDWFFMLGQKNFLGGPDEHPQPAAHRGPGRHRHRRRPGLDAVRAIPVRHRQQRDRCALQRPAGAAQQAHHLHALGLHVRPGRLGLRLARQHHALRLRQRLRADRHHSGGRGRHQHLRWQRHHPGHRPWPGTHPAHEERPGAVRRQGRFHDHRRGLHPHRRRAPQYVHPEPARTAQATSSRTALGLLLPVERR